MASELAARPLCHTKGDLEDAMQQVAATFTLERLAPLFDSTPRRLQDCLQSGGATVSFVASYIALTFKSLA